MALALDGSATQDGPTGGDDSTHIALTTTQTNDIIVVAALSDTGPVTVSDAAGLTWSLRAFQAIPAGLVHVFYAVAPAVLTADDIKVQGNGGTLNVVAFGISGADTDAIFDPNGSLPAITYDHGGGAGAGLVSVSTTNAIDILLGVYFTAGTTAGPGWTLVDTATGLLVEYKIVSATQTGLSIPIGGGITDPSIGIGDAIMHLPVLASADQLIADFTSIATATSAIAPLVIVEDRPSLCAPGALAPFRCPPEDELRAAVLALLPRGRAWRTSDGGPRPGSIIYGYFAALTALLAYAVQRWCDLRQEFWCASHSETHDLWMAEYGLPDDCDPFPDLCAKVAAIGGRRCEIYQALVARLGWAIDCIERTACSEPARAGRARAGRARASGGRRNWIVIVVHLDQSPAYVSPARTSPRAGRLRAGRRLACPPNIGPLACLMDRIAPAHVILQYRTE